MPDPRRRSGHEGDSDKGVDARAFPSVGMKTTMRVSRLFPFLALLAAFQLTACKHHSANSGSAAAAVSAANSAVAQAVKRAHPDACAVLTASLVRATLGLAPSVQLQKNDDHGMFPMCTYSWPNPDAAKQMAAYRKHERAQMQKMIAHMRQHKGAQDLVNLVGRPPPNRNRVTLTLANDRFSSGKAARKSFETSQRQVNQGITGTIDAGGTSQKVTFRMKNRPVSGVGDEARWSPRMAQLSVLDGTRIFHVIAETHSKRAADLADAKKLAAAVMKKL